MAYCQWNRPAEEDLKSFGLNRDDLDARIKELLAKGCSQLVHRSRARRQCSVRVEDDRVFIVEYTEEPGTGRPWIQSIELEAEDF